MRRRLLALAAAAVAVVGGGAIAITDSNGPSPAKPAGHLWVTPIPPTPRQPASEPSHRAHAPTHRPRRKLRAVKGVRYNLANAPCISIDCGPYAAAVHYSLAPWGHTTTGYYIYLNNTALGAQIDDTTEPQYVIGGGDCGVTITLGVRQHDNSSNVGPLYTTSYTTPACPLGTFPLQVSPTGRFLETADGNPFLIVGDSPQSGIGNLSEANMTSYLADRASHGFNAVWNNVLCDGYTQCNANGTTADGVKPFTTGTTPSSYDLSTPNSTYFTRVHNMVAQAKADGIEMFLDPIETGGCQTGGWITTLENNGNGTTSSTTKDYKYGQYLGNTFKDLNNIIWMSGNDFLCVGTAADNNDGQAVALGIRNTDPGALQTMEPDYFNPANGGATTSLTDRSGDPTGWNSLVDLNAAYTYAPTYAGVLQARSETSTQPSFLVEANYEGQDNGSTVDGCVTIRNCRLQEWWTMTSGAAGQLYGGPCYGMTNSTVLSDCDTTAVTQLGYQTSLLSGLEWQNLVPDANGAGHLITAGGGSCPTSGLFASVTCVTAAETPDETLALAYDPTGTTLTVDFSKMGGPTTARWWDPTNNTFTAISGSPFSTGATSQSIATPGANTAGDQDWVLVLQDDPASSSISCDLNATTSTFSAQVAAATSGQTVCLANGTYGTWTGGTSKKLTIAPQPGASPNFCFDLSGSTSNVTIEGGITNYDKNAPGIHSTCGNDVESGASNITIRHMALTCDGSGTFCIGDLSDGPVVIQGNVFHDMLFPNTAASGVFANKTSTATSSVVVSYNLFEDMGADPIDPGSGATVIGNDFVDVTGSNPSDPRHTDWIQFNSNDVIAGNFGASGGCTQGIDAFDGAGSDVIEDNVIAGCSVWSLVAAGDSPGSTVEHNSVIGANGFECGSKTGNPESTPTVQDNILENGLHTEAINAGAPDCVPIVDSHNMNFPAFATTHSASDFIGTPTFAGGATPNTYAGFALATGSPGRNAASDGLDAGARVGLYPRPTGLP